METDLRRYLACMPALRVHLTLRVLSELPSLLEQVTPGEASAGYQNHERSMARLGGSGSSKFRTSNSRQFHTRGRRICGFTHLHPTNSRMIKTTSTMLAVIKVANVVSLYSRAS